jgi:hypothetical protein
MSNRMTRTWDHRGSKPFNFKLLPLNHHLDGLYIYIYIYELDCVYQGGWVLTLVSIYVREVQTFNLRIIAACFLLISNYNKWDYLSIKNGAGEVFVAQEKPNNKYLLSHSPETMSCWWHVTLSNGNKMVSDQFSAHKIRY